MEYIVHKGPPLCCGLYAWRTCGVRPAVWGGKALACFSSPTSGEATYQELFPWTSSSFRWGCLFLFDLWPRWLAPHLSFSCRYVRGNELLYVGKWLCACDSGREQILHIKDTHTRTLWENVVMKSNPEHSPPVNLSSWFCAVPLPRSACPSTLPLHWQGKYDPFFVGSNHSANGKIVVSNSIEIDFYVFIPSSLFWLRGLYSKNPTFLGNSDQSERPTPARVTIGATLPSKMRLVNCFVPAPKGFGLQKGAPFAQNCYINLVRSIFPTAFP